MIDMNRRGFLLGAAGALGALGGGCSGFPLIGGGKRRRVMDYWCTWETQVSFADRARRLPENKGRDVRDSDFINEDLLFGKHAWVKLFPGARQDLVLMFDAGWDYPYGTNRQSNGGRGISAYGSMTPDPVRFPSLKGTNVQKLTALRRRIEDAGWGGLGLWVAPQKCGEWRGAPFPKDVLIEDMKWKLAESQAAGISYWKVDIGVHQGDIWYCQTLSTLADEYAPDVVIDHSCAFANPMNGVAHPHIYAANVEGPERFIGKTGRMIGVPGFEPWDGVDPNAIEAPARMSVRELYLGLMKGADSFRSYDTLYPMDALAALERGIFELQCADSLGASCSINVEDNPLIGAALGVGIGVMRSVYNEEYEVEAPEPRKRRMTEITRAVRWHETAPVFGSDVGCPVRFSEETAEESWKFEKNSTWWPYVFGNTYFQRCPAVVSRGIALPKVAYGGGERPAVLASRNPLTGALTVASLPFLTVGKGRHTPPAEISLDAALEHGTPLGVFGDVKSVTLRDGTAGRPVFAMDLAGGRMHDITDVCRRTDGFITISGERLSAIGREMNASGDCSSPGVEIAV